MTVQRARNAAAETLANLDVDRAPIDVERVARRLGMDVVEVDLGPDVSGLLVTVGEKAKICVHEGHHRNRKRFTIAHEIGHYVLKHQFGTEHVHVDKGSSVFINHRNPKSSEGIDPKEIEANQFAACLLMPTGLIQDAVKRDKLPLAEERVSSLAKAFQVSEQSMTIRLTTLGMI